MMGGRRILATAVCIGASTLTHPPAAASNLSEWQQACVAEVDLTTRAPAIDEAHIREAMLRFHQHGSLDALVSLPTREACLSFAATAVSKTPTVVMFADQNPPENRRRIDRPGPLRHLNEIEHHAERLAEGGWLLVSGLNLDNSIESRIYINRGVLAGADTYNQGYAALGDNLCTISLPESSYASFVRQQRFYDWQRLTKSDREYIERAGDAVVFWHEVAHCNPDQAMVTLTGSAESDQMQSWAHEQEAGQESCDESSLKEWSREVQQLQLEASSPWDLVNGEKDTSVLNDMIHYQLIQESVADRFGITMADAQMNQPQRGCASKESVNHPWYRMRLSLSISEPDARYMTWLTPWLTGLGRGVTHQVMVDAHAGLMDQAKKTLPEPMWMELSASRLGRPDRHEMTDPHGTPNAPNVAAWSSWTAEQVSGSGLVE